VLTVEVRVVMFVVEVGWAEEGAIRRDMIVRMYEMETEKVG